MFRSSTTYPYWPTMIVVATVASTLLLVGCRTIRPSTRPLDATLLGDTRFSMSMSSSGSSLALLRFGSDLVVARNIGRQHRIELLSANLRSLWHEDLSSGPYSWPLLFTPDSSSLIVLDDAPSQTGDRQYLAITFDRRGTVVSITEVLTIPFDGKSAIQWTTSPDSSTVVAYRYGLLSGPDSKLLRVESWRFDHYLRPTGRSSMEVPLASAAEDDEDALGKIGELLVGNDGSVYQMLTIGDSTIVMYRQRSPMSEYEVLTCALPGMKFTEEQYSRRSIALDDERIAVAVASLREPVLATRRLDRLAIGEFDFRRVRARVHTNIGFDDTTAQRLIGQNELSGFLLDAVISNPRTHGEYVLMMRQEFRRQSRDDPMPRTVHGDLLMIGIDSSGGIRWRTSQRRTHEQHDRIRSHYATRVKGDSLQWVYCDPREPGVPAEVWMTTTSLITGGSSPPRLLVYSGGLIDPDLTRWIGDTIVVAGGFEYDAHVMSVKPK